MSDAETVRILSNYVNRYADSVQIVEELEKQIHLLTRMIAVQEELCNVYRNEDPQMYETCKTLCDLLKTEKRMKKGWLMAKKNEAKRCHRMFHRRVEMMTPRQPRIRPLSNITGRAEFNQ